MTERNNASRSEVRAASIIGAGGAGGLKKAHQIKRQSSSGAMTRAQRNELRGVERIAREAAVAARPDSPLSSAAKVQQNKLANLATRHASDIRTQAREQNKFLKNYAGRFSEVGNQNLRDIMSEWATDTRGTRITQNNIDDVVPGANRSGVTVNNKFIRKGKVDAARTAFRREAAKAVLRSTAAPLLPLAAALEGGFSLIDLNNMFAPTEEEMEAEEKARLALDTRARSAANPTFGRF